MKKERDSLGDRMKSNYENRYRLKLTRRMPVIIRLDGKAFHTLTKGCSKPYDWPFAEAMDSTGKHLVKEIQGCKCAYIQSDEISLLLTDFDRLTTDAWFDYNIQKMVSVSAAMASVFFSRQFGHNGLFDARAFNIPKEEVCNYFVWRQQDWTRNSLQMMAQAIFSQRELQHKNKVDMHEMLHKRGLNWAKLFNRWKNGCFTFRATNIHSHTITMHDVVFTQDRDIVENLMVVEE